MTCEWTNEFTLKFLELYQNEPVIWDPVHSLHKDKKKINHAWARLAGQLGCSTAELKKKKDSLMASFRSHLRKKKASIHSGADANDVYTPIWFAYERMESFLAPIYKCQTTASARDDTFFVTCEESQSVVTGDTPTESTIVAERPNSSTPSLPNPTVRRRGNPRALEGAGNRTKEAFDMLKDVIAKRAGDRQDEDEYDLFGRMLAKKIRKLPELERQVFMYEIEGMYIDKLREVRPK
ncbi:uncharacterized protein LOC126835579 [Adelges cooleyi]|uniref:uncharacterized protein LOC126835579 n=1 Tax=Adelges cooleyi TaxID=133065 RepID=UPI0021809739|nr:uncharacterized protein LOC126835579 [Adelges cooleyi]